MAHRITFKKGCAAVWNWTDEEKQIQKWKKSVLFNEIIIKVSGRNIYSTTHKKGRFREHITYTLYDYSIFLEEKKNPLEIALIFKDGIATDISIPTSKRYALRPSSRDILTAILLADEHYGGSGGVVYKQPRLHQQEELCATLFQELEKLQERNKKPR